MPPHFVTFHDLLLVETVRAIEANTPLEDTAALQKAVDAEMRREDRIALRARRERLAIPP